MLLKILSRSISSSSHLSSLSSSSSSSLSSLLLSRQIPQWRKFSINHQKSNSNPDGSKQVGDLHQDSHDHDHDDHGHSHSNGHNHNHNHNHSHDQQIVGRIRNHSDNHSDDHSDDHAHDHAHNHAHNHAHDHNHGVQKPPRGNSWSFFNFRNLGHSHSHSHGHSHAQVDPKELGKEGAWITWVGIGVNVGLAGAKGIGGVVFNSASLVADGAHSFSDLISDFVTLATLKISRKPRDSQHPYGYGRYETLGTLGVASLLLTAGVGIGHHSYERILAILSNQDGELILHPAALGLALFSILIKEWLFQKTTKVGMKIRSPVLLANAWHHRSDALSSVVAFVGIGASLLGVPLADPISGFLVGGMIIKIAFDMGWNCIKEFMDLNVGDVVEKVKTLVAPFQDPSGDIRNIHDIRARKMGSYTMIDLHILIDPFLSVSGAQQSGQKVRAAIMKKFPEITEVMVHMDVDEDTDPKNSFYFPPRSSHEIEADVKRVLESNPDIRGVSHVVTHFLKKQTLVEAQIIVDELKTVWEAQLIAEAAKKGIESLEGVDEAHVDLEMTQAHQWKSLEPNQERNL